MSNTSGQPVRRRVKPAKGVVRGAHRRIVTQFDDETFSQVSTRAQTAGVSFAEMVRQLVEWGLEA